MLPLRWSERAVEDLGAIADYIFFYRLRDDCIELHAIVHGRIGKPDAR